ncbi:MAG TPA: HAMP domain-containing sensor histidine kinase, partial [Chloroflexota bacterium]|nr:HAMP domain-containing sensor histidine kinase [Chloroflexota bacterium]
AHGRTIGAVSFVYAESGRRYAQRDVDVATELAARAAFALDHARLYREAQDAIRSRDDFLASAAHDLKTPLAAVKGMAQFLARQVTRSGSADLPQLAEGLASVDASATRLARQIDQLLDISRLRAGLALDLRRKPTDLVALAEKAAAEHRRPNSAHTVRIETEHDELVGEWDRARLERVFDNLIGNALKYSPGGGEVVVSLTRRREEGGSEVAEVTVRDRGIGIPAADLPYVFDRFHRGSNVPETIGGTGIGLASVRQIAEQHGGTVDVQSVQGAGSTFIVRLPFARAEAPIPEPLAA